MMWYARISSEHPRHWNIELHMPLAWKDCPTFTPELAHLSQETLDRAWMAFPEGSLILKGVYFKKDRV